MKELTNIHNFKSFRNMYESYKPSFNSYHILNEGPDLSNGTRFADSLIGRMFNNTYSLFRKNVVAGVVKKCATDFDEVMASCMFTALSESGKKDEVTDESGEKAYEDVISAAEENIKAAEDIMSVDIKTLPEYKFTEISNKIENTMGYISAIMPYYHDEKKSTLEQKNNQLIAVKDKIDKVDVDYAVDTDFKGKESKEDDEIITGNKLDEIKKDIDSSSITFINLIGLIGFKRIMYNYKEIIQSIIENSKNLNISKEVRNTTNNILTKNIQKIDSIINSIKNKDYSSLGNFKPDSLSDGEIKKLLDSKGLIKEISITDFPKVMEKIDDDLAKLLFPKSIKNIEKYKHMFKKRGNNSSDNTKSTEVPVGESLYMKIFEKTTTEKEVIKQKKVVSSELKTLGDKLDKWGSIGAFEDLNAAQLDMDKIIETWKTTHDNKPFRDFATDIALRRRFRLVQIHIAVLRAAGADINKDTRTSTETQSGRRNFVLKDKDRDKVLSLWEQKVAELKDKYNNFFDMSKLDPIMLYNSDKKARTDALDQKNPSQQGINDNENRYLLDVLENQVEKNNLFGMVKSKTGDGDLFFFGLGDITIIVNCQKLTNTTKYYFIRDIFINNIYNDEEISPSTLEENPELLNKYFLSTSEDKEIDAWSTKPVNIRALIRDGLKKSLNINDEAFNIIYDSVKAVSNTIQHTNNICFFAHNQWTESRKTNNWGPLLMNINHGKIKIMDTTKVFNISKLEDINVKNKLSIKQLVWSIKSSYIKNKYGSEKLFPDMIYDKKKSEQDRLSTFIDSMVNKVFHQK